MSPQSYFGVDIGNSGLRVVELDTCKQSFSSPTRVDWSLDGRVQGDADRQDPGPIAIENADSSRATRFLPSSDRWLERLRDFTSRESKVTWLISSVRRDACQVLRQAIDPIKNHQTRLVSARDLPLEVDTQEPDRVGIDRLLAAWAAGCELRSKAEYGTYLGPLIVIQAGSAVTVDLARWTHHKLQFEGGAIVPGVPMMLRLLGTAADLLPQLEADELTDMPALPGKNTEQAMRCGTSAALVGGVGYLIDCYRDQVNRSQQPSPVPVILSGGDGTRLANHVEQPLFVVPDLVQRGLLILATNDSAQ